MNIRKFIIAILAIVALAAAAIYSLYKGEPVWAVVFGFLSAETAEQYFRKSDN